MLDKSRVQEHFAWRRPQDPPAKVLGPLLLRYAPRDSFARAQSHDAELSTLQLPKSRCPPRAPGTEVFPAASEIHGSSERPDGGGRASPSPSPRHGDATLGDDPFLA